MGLQNTMVCAKKIALLLLGLLWYLYIIVQIYIILKNHLYFIV